MGCDSHPYIEKRRKDGTWVVVDDKHRYYKYLAMKKDEENTAANREKRWEVYKAKKSRLSDIFGNRNYTLFSVLADVRNRRSIISLFPGRGMPENAATKTKKELPEDSDYHSHTFFTLADLLQVDPNAVGEPHGEVTLYPALFQQYKETGKVPDGAPEYVNGNEVSPDEMSLLLLAEDHKKLVKKVDGYETGPYVRVQNVPRTYMDLVPELFEAITIMKSMTKDPEALRVIIAFDN